MRKSVSVFMIVSMGIVLVLCGCNMSGTVAARIAFEDRDTTIPRAFSEKADLPPPDETLDPLREFYGSLGNKVDSYTPSEFKLFIQEIVLYNDTTAIQLDEPFTMESAMDPSPHYADFVNPIVLEPSTGVPPGTYTGMFFFFFTSGGNVVSSDGNTEVHWEMKPSIIVDLPSEYEGVWEDHPNDSFPNLYDIEGLGGGQYVFAPWVLQPHFWITEADAGKSQSVDFRGDDETIQRIEKFAYLKDSEYRAILPGISGHPEIWDTGDDNTLALSSSEYGSVGNSSALIMPFDGVTITEDAEAVTFRVQWDLDGIVEVYNNSTAEKSDDIIILAENFWERFSLIPEVQ